MLTRSDLSVAAGRFQVRVWSAGDGPPLLYLHGFDGHPGEAGFLERLAGGRRVIAPEHPGFGESTGGDQIDGILDMVLYLRQLLETLGHGRVDLVGHSLGGMFAAEFAAICPQHVRRLVLVAPFGVWLDDAQIPDLFVMSPGQLQRATWHDPESPRAQQALSALSNGYSGIPAIVKRAGNLSMAGKFLWPIPDRGLARRLELIAAPTLVLLGASDRLIPAPYAEAFTSRIAGARAETIADAGHSPMLEQPEAFIATVERFLSQ
jgi:pimeloyl-ACP methyl ester carboxylesterase